MMNDWIDIKEEFPERDQEILLRCLRYNYGSLKPLKYTIVGTMDENGSFRWLTSNGMGLYPIDGDIIVTHWMLLPEPPKGEIK